MLKGIPNIISPELLKILMEMGHGDEILISDGNFPAAAYAQRLVRCDGHGVPEILEAILKLFPLDNFVAKPVTLMEVPDLEKYGRPLIWDTYYKIAKENSDCFDDFGCVPKPEYMERARKAYAIIATSEKALFANVLLQKGVVTD